MSRPPPEGSERHQSSSEGSERSSHPASRRNDPNIQHSLGSGQVPSTSSNTVTSPGSNFVFLLKLSVVVGTIGALVIPGLCLKMLGFGPGGIDRGSYAASFHSWAVRNGVGLGIVSSLQSAGAAGVSLWTWVIVFVFFAALVFVVGSIIDSLSVTTVQQGGTHHHQGDEQDQAGDDNEEGGRSSTSLKTPMENVNNDSGTTLVKTCIDHVNHDGSDSAGDASNARTATRRDQSGAFNVQGNLRRRGNLSKSGKAVQGSEDVTNKANRENLDERVVGTNTNPHSMRVQADVGSSSGSDQLGTGKVQTSEAEPAVRRETGDADTDSLGRVESQTYYSVADDDDDQGQVTARLDVMDGDRSQDFHTIMDDKAEGVI